MKYCFLLIFTILYNSFAFVQDNPIDCPVKIHWEDSCRITGSVSNSGQFLSDVDIFSITDDKQTLIGHSDYKGFFDIYVQNQNQILLIRKKNFYDMELKYLKKDSVFTFLMPVMIEITPNYTNDSNYFGAFTIEKPDNLIYFDKCFGDFTIKKPDNLMCFDKNETENFENFEIKDFKSILLKYPDIFFEFRSYILPGESKRTGKLRLKTLQKTLKENQISKLNYSLDPKIKTSENPEKAYINCVYLAYKEVDVPKP